MSLKRQVYLMAILTLAVQQAWAADKKLEMTVTLYSLVESSLNSIELCSGSKGYDIVDARKSTLNPMPTEIFRCTSTVNQKSVTIQGGGGAALIRRLLPSGQSSDENVHVIYVAIDGKNHQSWSTSADLSPKGTELTWNLPVPENLSNSGATSEWIQVVATFRE